MGTKKTIYPLVLLFIIGLYTSCDTPTANKDTKSKDKIVIFQNSAKGTTDQQINSLIKRDVLQKSQIKFRYENKISGFSAKLSSLQVNYLNSKKNKDWEIIPGQFIVTFKDPFNGKKYITDEGHAWSMKMIKKMQKKYNISDDQILSKYGYASFGFAAKLNDKQFYKLDHEKLVKNIEPNVAIHVNWGDSI
jgi:hypothetical protein